MLTEYLTETKRDWDRGETVGASEIGQCARRTSYVKDDTPEDNGYEDSWGMKERGHWVEAWVVKRLRENGAPIYEAGDEQVTRSDGFLSATADGWIEDCEVGSLIFPFEPFKDNVSVDVKSFDPRKHNLPEPGHIIQVRLGAKLNPNTRFGVLVYVNASDYEDQQEFGPYPELTDEEMASLKERARDLMAKPPEEHLREGYFTNDCSRFNCPFRQRCIGDELTTERALDDDALAKLKEIQAFHADAKAKKEEAERQCRMAQEDVRQLFQAAGTKKVTGIASISRQTRPSLDTEAMERDGIDLARYRKDGKPFDVITIRKPKGAKAQ